MQNESQEESEKVSMKVLQKEYIGQAAVMKKKETETI